MSKLIKVYGWRNIHTDEWYIGQTSRLLKYRALSNGGGYKRNTKFGIAIQEYGWDSFEENILRLCTSQEEADYWEQYFIKKYDSIENGYNTFIGGTSSGSLGYRFSEESKRKKSETLMGHEVSEETRKKLSEFQKGEKHPNFGKNLSDETRKKIAESHGVKGVLQYTKDGQFIKEFSSLHEAERQTGVCHISILKCCRGYERVKTAGGYIWRYA